MRVVRKDIDTCILFKGGVGDLASTTFTVYSIIFRGATLHIKFDFMFA